MKRRAGLILVWAVGAALVSGVIAPRSGSHDAWAARDRHDAGRQKIEQKIEKERRTLEQIKSELQTTKQQAAEVEKQREYTLQAVQDLDGRLAVSRQAHQEVSRKLKQKDREIQEINEQLDGLRDRVQTRRRSILGRFRVQYMEGRFGQLKAVLTAETAAELQRRVHYLSVLSKREYDLMQAYRTDAERLERIEAQRTEARDQMAAYKLETERKLEAVKGLKRDKVVLLAKITHEKHAYDRAVAELEKSAARVDSLLRELEQRRRAALAKPYREPSAPHPSRGTLLWPADGEVVSHFGRQKHPTFETYVMKKGIEIRTAEGSAIRAVMAGTVAYADWLKGYGLVAILDHGNGLFSLYAHASQLLVKLGDRVEAGTAIGTTGDTGMTGDNTLYFELRDGTEPVDPMGWLARRR